MFDRISDDAHDSCRTVDRDLDGCHPPSLPGLRIVSTEASPRGQIFNVIFARRPKQEIPTGTEPIGISCTFDPAELNRSGAQSRVRGRKPGDRHSERRAGNVIQANLVAEDHRGGIATMFTTDAALQILLDLSRCADGMIHEESNARLVE